MLKSQHYLFMEALVRRITDADPEATLFQEEFYRMQAGLSGELKLKNRLADYHFKSDYSILYNFECLNARGYSHQIDALLLTQQFVLVLEVKQISGQLFYKPTVHEFSRRTENNIEENLPNPFDQAYRHQLFIEQVLHKHHIQIPVVHLVVIANYRAKLDVSLETMPTLHLSGLPTFLEKLAIQFPPTAYPLIEIQSIFLKMKQTLPARRQIETNRLKSGVFCTDCDTKASMLFHSGYWHCLSCKAKSKNALLDALHDYRTLISDRMSNKAFREFTGINCRFAAKRILAQLNLQTTGSKRTLMYVIPDEIMWINL